MFAIFSLCVFSYIFRPIWFDESLTLSILTANDGIPELYQAYEVPNNHIVYSIVLSLWIKFLTLFDPAVTVFLFRIPSLAAAYGTLFIVWKLIKQKTSSPVVATSCAMLLGASFPFLIYGSAVRGYMLGTFLVLVALYALEKMSENGKWRYLVAFSALAILSVGVAPTFLAALAAVFMFCLVPLLRAKRYAIIIASGLIIAFCIPVFYGGIISKLLSCADLREGWFSRWYAMFNLYGAFAVSFFIVILFAVLNASKYKIDKIDFAVKSAIIFMPFLIFLTFPFPPFPRVFFPFLAIWLVMAGRSLGGLAERKENMLFFLSFVWIFVLVSVGSILIGQSLFSTDGRHDDMFSPYYARPSFAPDEAADYIASRLEDDSELEVFVTFEADHPAVFFYLGTIYGDSVPRNVKCDTLGRKPLETLGENAEKRLLICHGSDADLKETTRRFSLLGPFIRLDEQGKVPQISEFLSE